MKLIDLTGKVFGRLTVVRRSELKTREPSWVCCCSCGSVKTVLGSNLKAKRTTSCGCRNREVVAARSTKHGHACRGRVAREHRIWRSMLKRCSSPRDPAYKHYGGRGIKVCQRWRGKNGFQNFIADMGPCPDTLTLDRLENNKGYSPKNCAWRTRRDQSRNTRQTRMITFQNKTQCIQDWAEETGIGRGTLAWRLNNEWPVASALTRKPSPRRRAKSGAKTRHK